MKWITALFALVFLSGCCCTTAVVRYRTVVAPVVEPVMVYPYSQGPIDVTTTTIDYY